MKILFFSDIHFHHTHKYSQITTEGFSTRELEHISCAQTILDICKAEKIDKIVFGGDLYGPVGDALSCQTQCAVIEFLSKLSKDYEIDMIVGNHDCSGYINNQYSHKLEPFKNWRNINVFDKPYCIDNFVYMPYCLCDDYATSFLESINNKNEKIVFSHLEIKGICLGNDIFTQKGIDLDLLKQFKMVLQGHYHSGGSYAKNLQISGSTQRLSFKDKGISKNNIIIYDTDTNKIKRESFKCPDWLTFTDEDIDDILKTDINNYVRVDVSTDILITDEIKNKLDKFKGKEVHIDISRITTNRKVTEEVEAETELDTIKQFVDLSDNSDETKKDLVEEGSRLLNKVKI